MPPSTPPRVAAAGSAPAFPPPAFAQPRAAPDEDSPDDRAAPIIGGPPVPGRGQFNVFPQPQVANPQLQIPPIVPGAPVQPPSAIGAPSGAPATAPTGSTPTSPFGGVSVPGMIVPAPAPQQPGGVPGRPPD
jgi:hypothetical protein